MGVLIGILVGLAASAIAWIASRIFVSPRLGWSLGISRTRNAASTSGYTYRVKVKNLSWTRSILDLRIKGVVLIPVLRHGERHGYKRIRVSISIRDIDYFGPNASRTGFIEIEELSPRTREVLKLEGLTELSTNFEPTVEDVLRSRDGARLVFTAVGSDGWSGRARGHVSPSYEPSLIRDAPFVDKPRRLRRWAEKTSQQLREWLLRFRTRSRAKRHTDLGMDTNYKDFSDE
jgi:hypothetical protein